MVDGYQPRVSVMEMQEIQPLLLPDIATVVVPNLMVSFPAGWKSYSAITNKDGNVGHFNYYMINLLVRVGSKIYQPLTSAYANVGSLIIIVTVCAVLVGRSAYEQFSSALAAPVSNSYRKQRHFNH